MYSDQIKRLELVEFRSETEAAVWAGTTVEYLETKRIRSSFDETHAEEYQE